MAAGVSGVSLYISDETSSNARGGYANGRALVVFTLGMVRDLQGDEGLVAAIMGHEFGHVVKHHSGRTERQAAAQVIGILAGLLAGHFIPNALGAELAARAVGMGGTALVHSYDRDQEREADEFGIEVMAKAGYDPRDAARFWAKAAHVNQGGGLFSTHPSNAERTANAERLAAVTISAARGSPATRPAGPADAAPPTVAPSAPPPTATEQSSPAPYATAPRTEEHDAAGPAAAIGPSPIGAGATEPQNVAKAAAPDPLPLATPSSSRAEPGVPEFARNGLAPAMSTSGGTMLWGYVDKAGTWVIPPAFASARPFDAAGWAPVAVGHPPDVRWGYINGKGEWEISPQFGDAETFDTENPGFARVRVGSETFGAVKYLSRSGEVLDQMKLAK